MEDGSKRLHKRREVAFNNHPTERDTEVWKTFNNRFQEVQSVLDRNRALIRQVNDNHQSKMPDNMVKNVALIQEINGNISKVVSLYSHLSTNFFSACHQQRNNHPDGDGDGDGDD